MNINKIFTKIAFALAFVFFATVAVAQTEVVIPYTGNKTYTIPEGITSFKVRHTTFNEKNGTNYSDISETYYSNNYDGALLLTAPEGYIMTIKGNLYLYKDNDHLEIYDGTTTNDNS